MGGATLSLEYAPDGVAGQLQGNTRESAVLRYAIGGLKLAAIYYNGHDTNLAPDQAATGVGNNRFVYVGALYTFRGFSVSASYGNGRNPARDNAIDIDLRSAGLGYRFSSFFQVTSAVYYLKDRNNGANESTAYAFGADYLFSKRTTLYGQLGVVKNKGKMTRALAYGQPVAPGMSTTAAMLGIRHVL